MASIAAAQFTELRLAYRQATARLHHPRAGILIPLGFLLLFAFMYTPPRWQDWNQNSRFNLTRAIVDKGTVRIDNYAGNTGDYAEIDGHIYSDKAPGLSLMAIPVYAATKALEPFGLQQISHRLGQSESFQNTLNPDGEGVNEDRIETMVALYIATFVAVSIPAVIMLLLIALMVERLSDCRTAATLTVLAIGLATPVFSYSQAFYGHVPAAACIVAILALVVLRGDTRLSNRRILLIGLLAGWAIVIEYPVVVILVPIGLWLVVRERGRAVRYGVAGMIPALAVLVAYDLIAFGTVLPIGYEHSALWQEQHSTGFMSLTYPHADALWGLTFSQFRGLFFIAPILLLVIPGFVLGLRRPEIRRLSVVLAVAVAGFFLFISSSVMWWGGFSVGPRYLIPIVPLMALPLGLAIGYLNGLPGPKRLAGLLVVCCLGLVSGVLTWATTFAGQNYPSDSIRSPLTSYVGPAIQDGNVARNLGMVLQLDGVASLIPLAGIIAAGVMIVGFRLVARPVATT